MSIEEKITFLRNVMEYEDELLPEILLEELSCWDSMTKLSLMIAVEEDLQKELTTEEIKNFKTVQDILDYLN